MRSPTSLRTKLTVLLATPLAVLVAVAALNLVHASQTAHHRATAAERVELSVAATTAARQLAQERGLSASTLTTPGETGSTDPAASFGSPDAADAAAAAEGDGSVEPSDEVGDEADGEVGGEADGSGVPDELTFQRDQTSEAVDRLHTVIAAEDAGRPAAGPALDGLQELDTTRQDVDRGTATTDEVLGAYAEIIDPVLELGPTGDGRGDPAVASGLGAFDALSQGVQEVALERSLIGAVLRTGTIDAPRYQQLLGTVSNQSLWFDLFQRDATPAQLDSFEEVQALPSMASAQGLRDAALAAGPGGPVEGSADIWTSAMGRKLDLLDALADESGADLVAAASDRRDAAAGDRTIALLLVIAAVLFAAALLGALHRVSGLRLRRLVGATRHAAHDTLPEVVEIAQLDGAEAARRALRPLPRSGTDELDEIAEAVDALQVTAVGLASEGAVLRGNVHSVFLNFGTRTQDLVTLQLGHIDDLEARTDDPDTLADLFLLDHLATRLRRNAESLVVMAGADSPRPWARPVSVVNVVRAAAAEAADYSRVDVEPMAPAAVLGAAANDVSHLLAELLDNGLAFSPPDARVVVAGRWQHDSRYLVTVSDAGVGMSADQLAEANHRIAELPLAESQMAGYFGLFVVGRFARRHGIEVQLVASSAGGVMAEVLLPGSLLTGPTAEPGAGARAEVPRIRPAPPLPDHEDGSWDDGLAEHESAIPLAPLVAVPTDGDSRTGRTGNRHTAQPRWLRRRMRKPAGTRDNVASPAIGPATPPTMVGRGDD